MPTRYTLIQRLLHWLIVLLALGVLAVGMIFYFIEFADIKARFGGTVTDALYTYHKTFGILVFLLMVMRLILRTTLGAPAYAAPLPPPQRVISALVHWLLYLTLLAMPVLGWLGTAAGGYPVQFFDYTLPGLIAKDKDLAATLFWLHGLGGWLLIGLVTLHIGGAMMHWLVIRDGVMRRMSLP